ncbi:MAG: nucleotidyltransferase domain-containing protein [Egibacteraceae bacterium]
MSFTAARPDVQPSHPERIDDLTRRRVLGGTRLARVVRLNRLELPDEVSLDSLVGELRDAGAVFAFVHGSRAGASPHAGSDLDVAAWFGRKVKAWEIALPARVDLLVLDSAGLELSGRVAQHGVLILDDDPSARVAWQADRSKRYLGEAHRRRDLVSTVFGRG